MRRSRVLIYRSRADPPEDPKTTRPARRHAPCTPPGVPEATSTNRILAGLPDAQRQAVLARAERVDLTLRQQAYRRGEPIRDVYFIESGVGSMVNLMEDGTTVEVGTVGPEGIVGLPVFLGASATEGEAFIQIPGWGWRISAADFRDLLRTADGLSLRMAQYTHALMTQIAQGSACNRTHDVSQRCARWLLMTHDRVEGDEFPLTHEFLAQMLGVRRAGVTEAAGALQDAGFITYSRGVVAIHNRQGLEAASCECYGIITREFDRLLGL